MKKYVLGDIKNLFKNEIQEPFHYDLTFNNANNTKDLFNKISEIYKTGLVHLSGNNNEVQVKNITYKDIERMHKYMLSLGIEVIYKKLTDYEKTQYWTYLLDDLIKLPEINTNVTIDWKTQNIISSELKIRTKNKKESFTKIFLILKKHLLACQLTNFLGLNFEKELNIEKELKHYSNIHKFNNETHVISFDFANMAKYGKK